MTLIIIRIGLGGMLFLIVEEPEGRTLLLYARHNCSAYLRCNGLGFYICKLPKVHPEYEHSTPQISSDRVEAQTIAFRKPKPLNVGFSPFAHSPETCRP